MVVRYKMVRLPVDVFEKYYNVKRKMEDDLRRMNNKPVSLSFPQFFDTLISFNENWIEIDLNRLNSAFNGRKKVRR